MLVFDDDFGLENFIIAWVGKAIQGVLYRARGWKVTENRWLCCLHKMALNISSAWQERQLSVQSNDEIIKNFLTIKKHQTVL